MHRCLSLLSLVACAAPLAGCGDPFLESAGSLAAASVAAIPVFGRSGPDLVYSAITGKDCSVVRLDQGKSYCRHPDPPVETPPFCTRSLGTVECWTNPEAFGSPQHRLADAPSPTPEQEAYRTRRWPNL